MGLLGCNPTVSSGLSVYIQTNVNNIIQLWQKDKINSILNKYNETEGQHKIKLTKNQVSLKKGEGRTNKLGLFIRMIL